MFIGLDKAHDTTWTYSILTDIYIPFGSERQTTRFYFNYLTDRRLQLEVNSMSTDLFEQEIRVPQKIINDSIDGSLYVDDFLIYYR